MLVDGDRGQRGRRPLLAPERRRPLAARLHASTSVDARPTTGQGAHQVCPHTSMLAAVCERCWRTGGTEPHTPPIARTSPASRAPCACSFVADGFEGLRDCDHGVALREPVAGGSSLCMLPGPCGGLAVGSAVHARRGTPTADPRRRPLPRAAGRVAYAGRRPARARARTAHRLVRAGGAAGQNRCVHRVGTKNARHELSAQRRTTPCPATWRRCQ